MITGLINPHLFRKELLENRSKYLLCFFILGLPAVLCVFLFSQNGNHNPGFLYNEYIGAYWSSGALPQLGTVAAILLGMGLFSLERTKGTILFLFNTPLSRNTIFHTKVAAGLVLLLSASIASFLLLLLFSRMLGYALALEALIPVFILTFAGMVFIFILTVFFSVFTIDPVKAGAAAVFCCFILYGLVFFKTTRILSPYYYMSGAGFLEGANYPWIFLPAIFIAAIFFYIVAQWQWRRLEV